MGLFSRRTKEERAGAGSTPLPEPESVDGPVVELPEDGRPVSTPLTEAERARIDRGLEALAARGVDVDDLAAIGAAYDRAFTEVRSDQRNGAAELVELFGIAIGEHLARHSVRRWAVVTDVFGTDLGLVDSQADTVVVPHNLVSARWMRAETGWIPAVVGHLLSLRPRSRSGLDPT